VAKDEIQFPTEFWTNWFGELTESLLVSYISDDDITKQIWYAEFRAMIRSTSQRFTPHRPQQLNYSTHFSTSIWFKSPHEI